MLKKINGEVEFDFEEFFNSIQQIKEYIRRRYSANKKLAFGRIDGFSDSTMQL